MNVRLKVKIIEQYGSQFEFALVAGLHESVVSKVIRGRRELSLEEKTRWAEVLNCKPEDIFLKVSA